MFLKYAYSWKRSDISKQQTNSDESTSPSLRKNLLQTAQFQLGLHLPFYCRFADCDACKTFNSLSSNVYDKTIGCEACLQADWLRWTVILLLIEIHTHHMGESELIRNRKQTSHAALATYVPVKFVSHHLGTASRLWTDGHERSAYSPALSDIRQRKQIDPQPEHMIGNKLALYHGINDRSGLNFFPPFAL